MKLYRSFREEVPEDEYTIDLDKANVVRKGTDMTLVAYGAMVHSSIKAAEELEEEGISCEVIDLRTVSPIDIDTILEPLRKQTVQSLFKKLSVKQEWQLELLLKFKSVRFCI